MRIMWKGKFDGNEENLPHGEHKPNAVKFKEIDDIKKLGLVLNLLSVPLMIVTYAIVVLRGGFDVILEHFWIYWAGILAAIACLIPHEFIHAMCFRKEAYIYTNLKNGMLFVVAPEDMSKCSLPRKTQKTDTQNEKNAPEHHVQERFLLPINGVLPLFYPFNFSSILATCRKICLSVSLLLVSFSVSSFGLSVVVVAFFANPFSPAALMIAG